MSSGVRQARRSAARVKDENLKRGLRKMLQSVSINDFALWAKLVVDTHEEHKKTRETLNDLLRVLKAKGVVDLLQAVEVKTPGGVIVSIGGMPVEDPQT